MFLDESRGLYAPSYYNIVVNTKEDLHPLKNVSPKYISTYFHEYFHFLQDVTTPYGFDSAWNTFDRTIRLIEYIQQEKGPIELPLKNIPKLETLDINYRVQLEILRDKYPLSIKTRPFPDLMLEKVTLVERPVTEKIPSGSEIKFVQLHFVGSDGIQTNCLFGAMCVLETMTYLIQGKFFNTEHIPQLPYKSGINVVNLLSERLKGNAELIFALCDVSLFSPYPGWTFFELIQTINNLKQETQRAEDIYDVGFNFIQEKWGLWEKFNKYKDKLVQILSQLYSHDAFQHSKEWVLHIIEEGYKIREEDPTFMLNLYRSDVPFSHKLLDIYKRLGAPEAINAENKRWFAAPEKMVAQENEIHTVFLSAFKQIQNLLLFGKRECIMIRHCSGSKPKMPIDENCYRSPWVKAKQDPLCPFAALWKSFGLDEKDIIIK